jgi:hypothetical protein
MVDDDRLAGEARLLGGVPIPDGGTGQDSAAARIRLEDFRAGLTPEYRAWLAAAADKVLSPTASDLYDRWALTDDLDEWLATAREDLEYLRTGLEHPPAAPRTEPEAPSARS